MSCGSDAESRPEQPPKGRQGPRGFPPAPTNPPLPGPPPHRSPGRQAVPGHSGKHASTQELPKFTPPFGPASAPLPAKPAAGTSTPSAPASAPGKQAAGIKEPRPRSSSLGFWLQRGLRGNPGSAPAPSGSVPAKQPTAPHAERLSPSQPTQISAKPVQVKAAVSSSDEVNSEEDADPSATADWQSAEPAVNPAAEKQGKGAAARTEGLTLLPVLSMAGAGMSNSGKETFQQRAVRLRAIRQAMARQHG